MLSLVFSLINIDVHAQMEEEANKFGQEFFTHFKNGDEAWFKSKLGTKKQLGQLFGYALDDIPDLLDDLYEQIEKGNKTSLLNFKIIQRDAHSNEIKWNQTTSTPSKIELLEPSLPSAMEINSLLLHFKSKNKPFVLLLDFAAWDEMGNKFFIYGGNILLLTKEEYKKDFAMHYNNSDRRASSFGDVKGDTSADLIAIPANEQISREKPMLEKKLVLPKPPPRTMKGVDDDTGLEISVEPSRKMVVMDPKPKPEYRDNEIFTFTQQEAVFPGGHDGLFKYLSSNISYPKMAKQDKTEGTVYIEFVIERDGSITEATIKRDIGNGCGEEAKKVVERMPKWKPAMNNGHTVRSYFTLPVQFSLGN